MDLLMANKVTFYNLFNSSETQSMKWEKKPADGWQINRENKSLNGVLESHKHPEQLQSTVTLIPQVSEGIKHNFPPIFWWWNKTYHEIKLCCLWSRLQKQNVNMIWIYA